MDTPTTIIFAAVLLLLSCAVVLLFAMFGELSTRTAGLGPLARDLSVRELPDARLGAAPENWPRPFAFVNGEPGEDTLLIVLSSACGSCEVVAGQLSESQKIPLLGTTRSALVVSSHARIAGEDFLERHRLKSMPHFVDEGGDWVKNEFGVDVSPAALIVRDGRLASALVFTDLDALTQEPHETPDPLIEMEVVHNG